MPLGIEELLEKNCVSVVLPKEQRRWGLPWDKKGHLRPLTWPLLNCRGPLKEVKSEKAAPVSIRNETLCPATMPVTRSSESICMGWTWGLELRLRHWNNSGTVWSIPLSSEEPWSGVPGPPRVWPLTQRCWAWGGPRDLVGSVQRQSIFQHLHCLQVGQGLVGVWGFGQDLAQCPVWLHLKLGPGELGPICVA